MRLIYREAEVLQRGDHRAHGHLLVQRVVFARLNLTYLKLRAWSGNVGRRRRRTSSDKYHAKHREHLNCLSHFH